MSTRNIVPRNNGEGNLGVDSRRWKEGHFQDTLKVGGNPVVTDAPSDNTSYVRKNGTWESISNGGGSFDQALNTTSSPTFNGLQFSGITPLDISALTATALGHLTGPNGFDGNGIAFANTTIGATVGALYYNGDTVFIGQPNNGINLALINADGSYTDSCTGVLGVGSAVVNGSASFASGALTISSAGAIWDSGSGGLTTDGTHLYWNGTIIA